MRRALAVLATAAALAPGARRAPRLGGLHATEALGRRGDRVARGAGAGPTCERAAALAERLATASYADQLHPGCERKISIEKNGDRVIAHFAGKCGRGWSTPAQTTTGSRRTSPRPPTTRHRVDGVITTAGTDVGPKGIGDKVFLACSPDNVEKYKLRTWAFDGEIVGDRIDAGDGVHAGTWNVNFKGAENRWTGIRWKDGSSTKERGASSRSLRHKHPDPSVSRSRRVAATASAARWTVPTASGCAPRTAIRPFGIHGHLHRTAASGRSGWLAPVAVRTQVPGGFGPRSAHARLACLFWSLEVLRPRTEIVRQAAAA